MLRRIALATTIALGGCSLAFPTHERPPGATEAADGGDADGGRADAGADGDGGTSGAVPGGDFDRGGGARAHVSPFRLDVVEVTVGRFRRFLAAYTKPAIGSGKNPNDPADPGWSADADSKLASTAQQLQTDIAACYDDHAPTFTAQPGGHESEPMNCVRWREAFAFCVWDGGRLPTEAELKFAAMGGAEQRAYPWSSPPSSTAIDASRAVYMNAPIAAVGSKSPAGDGPFGHADLAGNVAEWAVDGSDAPPSPCNDCASLNPTGERVVRGGGFEDGAAALLNTAHATRDAEKGYADVGFRCARTP